MSAPTDDNLRQVTAVTGLDEDTAHHFLRLFENNVQRTIENYFAHGEN